MCKNCVQPLQKRGIVWWINTGCTQAFKRVAAIHDLPAGLRRAFTTFTHMSLALLCQVERRLFSTLSTVPTITTMYINNETNLGGRRR